MKKIKTHSCWNQHAQKKIQNTKNPFSGLINPGSTKSSTYYLFLTPVADEVVCRCYSLHGRLGPPSELILFVIEAKLCFNLEMVLGKCSRFFTTLGRRKWLGVASMKEKAKCRLYFVKIFFTFVHWSLHTSR